MGFVVLWPATSNFSSWEVYKSFPDLIQSTLNFTERDKRDLKQWRSKDYVAGSLLLCDKGVIVIAVE